jgi:hypothetical protein
MRIRRKWVEVNDTVNGYLKTAVLDKVAAVVVTKNWILWEMSSWEHSMLTVILHFETEASSIGLCAFLVSFTLFDC